MLIQNFIVKWYEIVNDWFKRTFRFDEIIKNFYDKFIAQFPEIVKILGAIFILFIFILGVFSFAKKFIKTTIVLAVIALIIILLVVLL